jgi:NADH-quinone oxidoreductase subunit H
LSQIAGAALSAGVVIANINVGVLYIFAISSLGVYGVIMAGWTSAMRFEVLPDLPTIGDFLPGYEATITVPSRLRDRGVA